MKRERETEKWGSSTVAFSLFLHTSKRSSVHSYTNISYVCPVLSSYAPKTMVSASLERERLWVLPTVAVGGLSTVAWADCVGALGSCFQWHHFLCWIQIQENGNSFLDEYFALQWINLSLASNWSFTPDTHLAFNYIATVDCQLFMYMLSSVSYG